MDMTSLINHVVAIMKTKPTMCHDLYKATIGAITCTFNLSNAQFNELVRNVECHVAFSIPLGEKLN